MTTQILEAQMIADQELDAAVTGGDFRHYLHDAKFPVVDDAVHVIHGVAPAQ